MTVLMQEILLPYFLVIRVQQCAIAIPSCYSAHGKHYTWPLSLVLLHSKN